MRIVLDQIVVTPERQRKDFGDITGLAASIRKNGLLQPLIVAPFSDGNYKLLGGERRLRAITSLGWTEVDVVLKSDLSHADQELVELEENVRRKELSWPEHVTAVARFYALAEADGRLAKDIAGDLQIPEATISKMRTAAKAIVEIPKLATASSWSSAYTLYTQTKAKETESLMEDVLGELKIEDIPASNFAPGGIDDFPPGLPVGGVLDSMTPEKEVKVKSKPIIPAGPIIAELNSFIDWAPTYTGKRFNLIHCDFPYGVGMDTNNLQGSADRWNLTDGRYDDSPELFDQLVRAFFDNQDKFIADSAHCIFWLAHKNVGKLMGRFRHFGWNPCDVALIWHKSDGNGIAPDVRRQPRRTYEIAIFASRGDRTIAKVKAASFAHPTTKEHHLSEKPLAVVSHFLEMVCDEHTEILDPTCGSGTALEAALRLGASRALGLDVLAQHVKFTNARCANIKSKQTVTSDLAGEIDLSDL